jgi:hypothetical protein
METIQTYQFNSSVAAVIASVVQFIFSIFFQEHNENESLFPLLFLGFAFIVFPTIVICICSHLQIKEGSKISFGVILLFGVIFLCFWGFIAFYGLLLGGGVKNYVISMIILVLPIFFVACTVIFAIINSLPQPPLTDNRLS